MGDSIRDEILAALADELDYQRQLDRIQGFLYGNDHVVRDVWLPHEEQELWRQSGPYDETHEAMMRQIRIERMRLAVASVAKRFGNHARLGEMLVLPEGPSHPTAAQTERT